MVCTDEILDGSLCNVEITNLDGTFCDVSALNDGDEILVSYYNRIGYRFDYWKDTEGNILYLEEVESGNENKHSFKAEARCGSGFIAVFTPTKLTIQTSTNINAAGTQTGGGYYNYGSQATLVATVNDGYYFDGWYYNNERVTASYEFTFDVVNSVTYTAMYSAMKYTVAVTPNDEGLGTTLGSGEYKYGSSCVIAAVPTLGSYFVSWSDGDTNDTRTLTITSDVTLQAIFKGYSYTVTVNKNVDWCFAIGGGEYTFNSAVTISARPANGYVFDHWETPTNPFVSANSRYTTTVTRDITYTAVFRVVGYTLSVYTQPVEGGTVNNLTPYITQNPPDTEVTLQPMPSEGYHYVGWADRAQDLNPDGSRRIVMKRDTTLTCIFAQD